MMHSKRNMLCFSEQSTSYVILTDYFELGTDYSERIKLYWTYYSVLWTENFAEL